MNIFSLKNIIKIIAIGLIFVVTGGFFAWLWFHSKPAKQPKITITVFIHGTVGSSLNIFNPWLCYSDNFNKDSRSARFIKKFRNHEGMHYDQILGAEGFCEFKEETLPTWHAARYIIPAYNACYNCVNDSRTTHKYTIFGWSGFLHSGARKEAGYDLYTALCDYRDMIVAQENIDPEIHIISHSHGGNVALWLADAEKTHKRGLRVNLLVMFGTPMQKEMQFGILSPLFKTIVLCYSEGDGIQQRDYFTTKARRSYQRMSDITDLEKFVHENPHMHRHDVACVVNNNDQQVTHTNMWLAGRSNPVLDELDPLPLVVYTPFILHQLNDLPLATALQFCMCLEGECCKAQIKTHNITPPATTSKNLYVTLQTWAQKMLREWQSTEDSSRHVFFNRKNVQALKHAIFG